LTTDLTISLTAVPARLEAVMPRLVRPAATSLAPGAAIGLALAEPIIAPSALPERSLALTAGYAVEALTLTGAAPQAPLIIAPPPWVAAGEPLPPGTDAVLPAFAVTDEGAFAEITASPVTGENARLAGHDLAAGAVLAPAGARVTPELVLASALAGIETLVVNAPLVAIDGFEPPAKQWLSARIRAAGGRILADSETEPPAMRIAAATDLPRLAMAPGEASWIEAGPAGEVIVTLPKRFDGLVAGFFALVAPVLVGWTGLALPATSLPLRRKLASRVGILEAVLLAEEDGEWLPLGIGEITLAGLGAARAIAFIGPESEGMAAGSTLRASLLVL
jgi:molybdopterin molybdotransferase